MESKAYEFIIVGQGLAGSMLAWELLEQGHSVCVIDNNHKTSSSSVAAGIVNPITGRWMTKSWEVEKFLPVAKQYYRKMAHKFGEELFFEKDILRILTNEKEVKRFEKISANEEYQPFIGETFPADSFKKQINTPLGAYEIIKAGFLKTKIFLSKIREVFAQKGCLIEEDFDHSRVQCAGSKVHYRNLSARHLIFCEGFKVLENPFFSTLPDWSPSKGEILTVKTKANLPDYILNMNKWMVPLGGGVYKVGSNYEKQKLNLKPTYSVKEDILRVLSEFIEDEIIVLEHQAGVRPATRNKRPVIAAHHEYNMLHVFNGFGSKGTLVIPYFAKKYAQHLSQCV